MKAKVSKDPLNRNSSRFTYDGFGQVLTVKDGRNWYSYCENSPVKRFDSSGLMWHDPTRIIVSPDFDGAVWVVGERGKGQGQVMIKLKPGESTPAGFDADIVIVVNKDGSQTRYFVGGANGPQDKEEVVSTYDIGKNGQVVGRQVNFTYTDIFGGKHTFRDPLRSPIDPFEFGSGTSRTDPRQGGYGGGNWNDDIEAAKRRRSN